MEEDTRRELDMLHQADRDLQQSIRDLDSHGSRGVLALQVQISDLTKDLGELKTTFVLHEGVHEQERQERKSNRRWIVGTMITGAASFAGVFTLLLTILMHLH